MAAPVSLSEIANFATGGGAANRVYQYYKNPTGLAGTIAPRWYSLWVTSGVPRSGATPTTVANPDNTTDGALGQTDASGGRSLWLTSFANTQAAIAGGFIVYDRLLHIGGLSGTVTTPQTVGGSLTRFTGGVGNFIIVEIYTQIGVTSRTITASYTDPVNGSGRTTQAMVIGNTNDRVAQSAIVLPLQSGDIGVTAVASVTLSASTGTAGNFGVTVCQPLGFLCSLRSAHSMDFFFQTEGPQQIPNGACIAALVHGAAQSARVWGQFYMGEK